MPRADAIRIDVAGTVFEVSGLDASSRAWAIERYGQFLTERAPDMTVAAQLLDEIPDADDETALVEFEGSGGVRLRLGTYRFDGNLGARLVCMAAPPLPSALSPAALRFLAAAVLLRAGGLVLHSAAVVDGPRARVFCGPSESGKTTIAMMAGSRAVLSDETVAIRPADGAYRVYATPFFGEAGPVPAQASGDAALAAIFFLRKSVRFQHRRLTRSDAIARALPQVFLPKRDPAIAEAILTNLDALTAEVPCFELEFAATAEVWSYLDGIV